MDEKRAELGRAIDKFLADAPKGDHDGWGPVNDEDETQLREIIEMLVEAKWHPDADGDYPVEITLVNRNVYERMHYYPVPYPFKGDPLDRVRLMMTNLNIATDAMARGLRALRYILSERGGTVTPKLLELLGEHKLDNLEISHSTSWNGVPYWWAEAKKTYESGMGSAVGHGDTPQEAVKELESSVDEIVE